MSDWSPEKTIAMERRHILESEESVLRRGVLAGELVQNGGRYQLVQTFREILHLLHESVELSWERLRDLERIATARHCRRNETSWSHHSAFGSHRCAMRRCCC